MKRISIVRGTTPFEMGLKSLIAAKLTNTPFCLSIHSEYDTRSQTDKVKPFVLGFSKPMEIIENMVIRNAKYILPIRESMIKNYLNNHKTNANNCIVIPHGMDLSFFENELLESDIINFKNKYKLNPEKKIISIACRLKKENFTDDIIKIIEKLAPTNKYFFFIAGDGPQRNLFKNLKEKHPDSLLTPGMIPQKDVWMLRRLSYINLLLMGGFSLIEACASGNPCITYDVEWHYELIKNGETGFIVSKNDVEKVIQLISSYNNRTEELKLLGERAKQLAISNHSLENTNNYKTNIFKKIINVQT